MVASYRAVDDFDDGPFGGVEEVRIRDTQGLGEFGGVGEVDGVGG